MLCWFWTKKISILGQINVGFGSAEYQIRVNYISISDHRISEMGHVNINFRPTEYQNRVT